jgi:hypothetical protein
MLEIDGRTSAAACPDDDHFRRLAPQVVDVLEINGQQRLKHSSLSLSQRPRVHADDRPTGGGVQHSHCAVRGRRGRPRRRPLALYADRAYDSGPHRLFLTNRKITAHLARKGIPHGLRPGSSPLVVEQSIALLHWFRRLRVRWEIRDDIHAAFVSLACAIICYRRLTK